MKQESDGVLFVFVFQIREQNTNQWKRSHSIDVLYIKTFKEPYNITKGSLYGALQGLRNSAHHQASERFRPSGGTNLLEQTNLFPQLWSAGFPLCHFPPVWGLFNVRSLRLPWFSDALSWGLQKRAGPCFCSTGASEGFPTAPKGHCVTFICLIYPLETSVLAW